MANTVANSTSSTLSSDLSKVETAASNEVSSLSTSWSLPVWAVIAILVVGGLLVLHFL